MINIGLLEIGILIIQRLQIFSKDSPDASNQATVISIRPIPL